MTQCYRPSACVGFISLLLAVAFISHASERPNRVSVIRITAAGQALKAQLRADGTIHLLLDSPDGPRYVKSQDDGRTFSSPIAVLDAASQKPGLTFQQEKEDHASNNWCWRRFSASR